MSRKLIPAEVRRMTGARVRPEHEVDEAVRPKAGKPRMPQFLDPEARTEWRRMTKLLFEMNALAKTHLAALSMYCVAWANVADLARKLTDEKAAAVAAGGAPGDALLRTLPSGIERPSATFTALCEAMAVCAKHLGELGLSPTAQARILATRADSQLYLPGVDDPIARKLRAIQGGLAR